MCVFVFFPERQKASSAEVKKEKEETGVQDHGQ